MTNFDRRFTVKIPSREDWLAEEFLSPFNMIIFTDGSKSESGCGESSSKENIPDYL